MSEIVQPKHWIVRVQDGENFRNSTYPFWGVKKGRGGCIKSIVNKMKEGDVLWFLTSKLYGGKIIAMAEFQCYYDRSDEPLFRVHTYSNKEQNWKGDDDWSIQIHYKNLYNTEKQNLNALIQCGGVILEYDTFKEKISPNLYSHYQGFKYYGQPVLLENPLC